jgi:hypothetical protein
VSQGRRTGPFRTCQRRRLRSGGKIYPRVAPLRITRLRLEREPRYCRVSGRMGTQRGKCVSHQIQPAPLGYGVGLSSPTSTSRPADLAQTRLSIARRCGSAVSFGVFYPREVLEWPYPA